MPTFKNARDPGKMPDESDPVARWVCPGRGGCTRSSLMMIRRPLCPSPPAEPSGSPTGSDSGSTRTRPASFARESTLLASDPCLSRPGLTPPRLLTSPDAADQERTQERGSVVV